MGERLGRVADQGAARHTILLAEQPDVVRHPNDTLEDSDGFVVARLQLVGVRQPVRARQKRASSGPPGLGALRRTIPPSIRSRSIA